MVLICSEHKCGSSPLPGCLHCRHVPAGAKVLVEVLELPSIDQVEDHWLGLVAIRRIFASSLAHTNVAPDRKGLAKCIRSEYREHITHVVLDVLQGIKPRLRLQDLAPLNDTLRNFILHPCALRVFLLSGETSLRLKCMRRALLTKPAF